jgi:hypothetical protein
MADRSPTADEGSTVHRNASKFLDLAQDCGIPVADLG